MQTKKPANGMKDITPREMELRNYVSGVIRDTYRAYGFTQIETPAVESISNLTGGAGGENEKLIFKILKRGEKLDITSAASADDLADLGLRYDLTVPLCRYYANNSASLPTPFKALQMGPVWRADRPQRGRYRQFTQCDIDILAEPGNIAEIELITATASVIDRLGFDPFEIRISDRRLLDAVAEAAGIREELRLQTVIALDKLDKIGEDGVRAELTGIGMSEESADRYLKLIGSAREVGIERLATVIPGSEDISTNLCQINEACVQAGLPCKLVFDPTLARGMGYYTGTIFEIAIPEFGGSCGGGGRYDNLVGRFSGQPCPACGFSIGFERIILLLTERGFEPPVSGNRIAYLIERGIEGQRLGEIMQEASSARAAGDCVIVERMIKNKRFQKEQLEAMGYHEIKEYYNG